jgi:DnaJ-class molecular chaperone
VTTLKGKVLLRIPAGTQNGRIFRLKGQGMPVLRKDDVGDILAKVRVVLPTNLGPEAEEAARHFIDIVDQPDPR